MKRISIFLIVVTLLAGMVGCGGESYTLTIFSSAGGAVTTPGEGTFSYDAGTVVNLVATPDAGYRFANWTGDVETIGNVNASETIITVNGDYSITANFEKVNLMVAVGDYHTLGLRSNGRVVAAGNNNYGQCDVGNWRDIIQIAAGAYHTLGLKSDGTVLAVGQHNEGQCEVGSWMLN